MDTLLLDLVRNRSQSHHIVTSAEMMIVATAAEGIVNATVPSWATVTASSLQHVAERCTTCRAAPRWPRECRHVNYQQVAGTPIFARIINRINGEHLAAPQEYSSFHQPGASQPFGNTQRHHQWHQPWPWATGFAVVEGRGPSTWLETPDHAKLLG